MLVVWQDGRGTVPGGTQLNLDNPLSFPRSLFVVFSQEYRAICGERLSCLKKCTDPWFPGRGRRHVFRRFVCETYVFSLVCVNLQG